MPDIPESIFFNFSISKIVHDSTCYIYLYEEMRLQLCITIVNRIMIFVSINLQMFA